MPKEPLYPHVSKGQKGQAQESRPMPQTIRVATRMALTLDAHLTIELYRHGRYVGTIDLAPDGDQIKVDIGHEGMLEVAERTPSM